MLKCVAITVALAMSALATTSSMAADYDGKYPRGGVEVDVERGRGHHDGDRRRHRGPRVGIVIGETHRGYGYCPTGAVNVVIAGAGMDTAFSGASIATAAN